MKTVEEVIKFLEGELLGANELYDQAKGRDAQAALYQRIKIATLTHLLEEIRGA